MPRDTARGDLQPVVAGMIVGGRYRLERELGRGSMGSVWRARHLALKSEVAIKFLEAKLRVQPEALARFSQEAMSAARVRSSNVVRVLDYGDDAGRPYIVMELLHGEDLQHRLRREMRLSLPDVLRVVSHTCRGLAKAHAEGIVHRDIKPENLFLCGHDDDEEGSFTLKILDFGIAKVVESIHKHNHATMDGQLVGSPSYMSPEQAQASPLDYRSDLFSAAVVAYHALTGVLPFPGRGITDTLIAILTRQAAPPSDLVAHIPPAVDDWFRIALHKDPKRRFSSARVMAESFSAALDLPLASIGASMEASSVSRLPVASRDLPSGVIRTVTPVGSTEDPRIEVDVALSQVMGVTDVLGVALLTPMGRVLGIRALPEVDPAVFLELQVRVTAMGSTLLDRANSGVPRTLAMELEQQSLFARWLDGAVVLVLARPRVATVMLNLSLDTLSLRLASLVRRTGDLERISTQPNGEGDARESVSGRVPTLDSASNLQTLRLRPLDGVRQK